MPEFKIEEIGPGVPDLRQIEGLDADRLAEWIRARLSGEDPFFPLHESKGEERDLIFVWALKNSFEKDFIDAFGDALAKLLAEEETPTWDEKEEGGEDLFYRLVFLIRHYYSLCSGREGFDKGEGPRRAIYESLFHLCRTDGPLVGRRHNQADVYLRALYSLRAAQADFDADFWKEVFELNEGVYSPAAFGAFANRDLDAAIQLLPAFLEARRNDPDRVAVDYELFALYETYPAIREKECQEKIRKMFIDKYELLRIFVKELEKYDVRPFNREILIKMALIFKEMKTGANAAQAEKLVNATYPHTGGIMGSRKALDVAA